jgi:hypothetical protein
MSAIALKCVDPNLDSKSNLAARPGGPPTPE